MNKMENLPNEAQDIPNVTRTHKTTTMKHRAIRTRLRLPQKQKEIQNNPYNLQEIGKKTEIQCKEPQR